MKTLIVLCIILVSVGMLLLKIFSPQIKGFIGELKVNLRLRLLGKKFVIIPNVMLENPNGSTSQIDHLVISEYGIFVIETKNYAGWIMGCDKADDWQQIIFKEKHYFRNPIKQNLSHIYALKNVLSDYHNVKYYPIVVFVGNATLKRLNVSQPVIYANRLRATIKQNCINKCLSLEDVQIIKQRLQSSDVSRIVSRRQHIQNIQDNIQEKQFKINNLICPWCNGDLKLRSGVNGMFYGCSNYPKCKFTVSC